MRQLLRFPWIVWLVIAAGWGYMTYTDWQSTTEAPLLAQIQAKQADLQTKKAEVARGEAYKATRDSKLRKIEELGERSQLTVKQLPRSAQIPEVLRALADNSDRAGLDFLSIKPQTASAKEFIIETPIEVQLKGSYVQLMTFLDASVNLTRVIRLQKLELSQPATRGLVASLTAKAILVSYHIDENLLKAAPPAPVKASAADPKGKTK